MAATAAAGGHRPKELPVVLLGKEGLVRGGEVGEVFPQAGQQ